MRHYILVFGILLGTLPWINAQVDEPTKPQVLVNLGWGALESEYDMKGALLLAAETQVTYKHNLFSARALFGKDNDYADRKLNSYAITYGYIEHFDKHSIYVSTGLSWNQFKENADIDGEKELVREYDEIGFPLNAGFNVSITQRMGLNAQAFYNFNSEDSFIGYFVALRARLY